MASGWTAAAIVPAVVMLAAPAWARVESAPVVTDRTRATLEADAAVPGAAVPVALRLQLKPGWHTYWRNPGDSGEPASVTLHVQGRDIKGPDVWPVPERIDAAGIISYGHHGDVVLVTTLQMPAVAGAAVDIDAEATWLVCEKVCVPETGRFALHLPVATGSVPGDTRSAPPRLLQPPSITTALFARTAQNLTLRVPTTALGAADGRVIEAYFFPERGDQVDHSAPQVMQPAEGEIVLVMPAAQVPASPVSALRGVLAITRLHSDGTQRNETFQLAAQPAP